MFGCSDNTEDFLIEVIEAPQPILNLPTNLCISDVPLSFTSSESDGIWSGLGITDSINGTFDPSLAGEGTTTIIYDIAGICPTSASGDIVVEIPPLLTITDPGLICSNQNPINLEANMTGGSWSGDGIQNQNNGLFDPQTLNTDTTEITYSVSGVCPVEDQFLLEISPAPMPDAGTDVAICAGDSILLFTSGNWDSADWNGNGQSSLLAYAGGIYTLTVGLGGCYESDDLTITIINYPNLNIGQDMTLCIGQTTTLYAPYIGVWSTGAVADSIVIGNPGMVTFTYPNSGCPVVDSLNIEVLTYPIVNLGPDVEICPGESTTLEVNDEGLWTTGEYSNFIDVSTESVYAVEVWNGPCMSSDTIFVDVLSPPVADLGPDAEGCVGEPMYLFAANPANDFYEWSDGTEGTEYIIVDNNGTYSVETSNECGSAFDEIIVTFADCTPAYYIPNAFTPDGDGINDFWHPITYRLTAYELIVFDRWGIVVFTSFNPDEVWTGNFNGGEHFVKDDVYFYLMKYTTDEGLAGKAEGTVTMVR
jgi:gliding motility-associated-like protein